MRTNSLRRLLRDAWRQGRSMDPEQATTTDLLASNRLRQEIARVAAQAAALHAARLVRGHHERTS